VVPNGVDCAHNHLGQGEPQPYRLVFSGALQYRANYDAMQYFLAEIYPLVRRQVSDVNLTITGPAQGIDLKGLELDGSVRLSGFVDDIRPLVAGASVCIVPLREGGGTRLKILEAMALGTPVVATSKAVEGLDVMDGVHFLQADTPAQFVDQILRLFRDPATRLRLVRSARQLVEQRYDWRRIGLRFLDLLEHAATKRLEDARL